MRTRLFKSFLVLSLLILSIGSAWAGTHYVSAATADPAQGLVYVSKSNESNVADSKFKNTSPGGKLVGNKDLTGTAATNANACYITGNETGCTPSNEYYWARPSRGYEFNGSWGTRGTNYVNQPSSTTGGCTQSDQLNKGPWTGDADVIQSSAGGSASTWYRPTAYFKQATKYVLTYAVPVGGSYAVHYEYLESYNTGDTESDGTAIWKFKTSTEDYSLTPSTEEDRLVDSYAADAITMTASGSNFVGWYDGTTQKSTNATYTGYKASANATITALFKTAILGTPAGDLSPSVAALGSNNYTITIPVTAHGNWSAGDFNVAFAEQTSPKRNDVTKGTEITYVQNSGNVLSSNGTLTIPYTYNPTTWGNTEILVTVTPKTGGVYGDPREFTIRVSAVEPASEEAEIWEGGVKTHEGDLVPMVTLANTLTTNPTVRLRKDVTITSPLSLSKSMKFNLNDKTITCTASKAFSIDATGIDVQIVDEGFGGNGTIAVTSAQSGNVNVVTFTQKAKLTMNGGTLSATNTGAGGAYGLDVRQGSVFYMTGGNLTVTAATDARGVNVATSSDYATFSGGSITVTAPTNAYGLWSAGQSNVTGATIAAETTTGANAYGVYVNGGVSTLTTNTVSASAKTTGAYGAYVNAGRLNGNGGSFAAEAVTSGVYGVHVAAGATAMLQQNAVVTAEATSASGTSVFGVNNLGTVSLTNVSVTATSPTTAATAVNTATSAVSTTIDGGTYRANTTGGTAYGLHHQYGALTVDGGTFRAIGSGNNIYGGRAAANGSIANATLRGETQGTGNTAYGFVGGVVGKNITLTNCTIEGISNTSKAYAIYSRANVTATGCTLTATVKGTDLAYGVYAEDGTNSLVNCNATVTAQTTSAYGAYHKSGSLSLSGGTYNVEAKQTSATAAQDSKLYGLYNEASKTTTVSDATFTAIAANAAYSQNVYGAFINGSLNSTGATYNAEAKLTVYGVYGNTASTLNMSGNTISSRTTNGTKSYGVYARKNFTIDGDIVSAVGSTTDVYALYFDATNSVGEVKAGKFSAVGNGTTNYGPLNAAGTVGKVVLKGGVYSTNTNLSKYAASGYNVYNLDETHPDYAGGYRYIIATSNPSPYVCKIVSGNFYTTLEAALQYTKDNSGTYVIVMLQDYTLPAGDYELPSNATLLIPHKLDQNAIYGAGTDNSNKTTVAKVLAEHMRLTFASNAHLNVSGKIEVSGQMYCVETGHISFINGPYGHIRMESGSLIQLNSGAYLYAWGKITGTGEIKVKNNAEVHEMFQIYGMPSMSNIVNVYMNNSHDFFPVQQYEINNIEVPATYYYNSRLICAMSNYYKGVVGNGYNKDDAIKVIGTSGALFLVDTDDESSWVRKSYKNSYQVWEANSAAKLGSLKITMDSYTLNSAEYILPITTNMKVHILDGNFTITQHAQLLPGSQIEINKTGKLTVNTNCNLYVFDADQSMFTSKPDAAVNVHGNIDVKGKLYTTQSIAGGTNATNGANIYSNNADAGTVHYSTAAGTGTTTVTLMTSPTATKAVTMERAQLKNGVADPAFTSTSGAAVDDSYIYIDNQWKKSYQNGCFFVIEPTVYAKPSEYVALKKTQTVSSKLKGVEEDNHTYLTADDKILILMDDCQWWEVEATEDPTIFECKKEGYEGFYYYDNSTGKWKLKTVTVTFYSAETGTNILKTLTTDWKGVPDQAVIATNPTKATTAAATYTFYGWKSSVTGNTYHWTETLEEATANMNYRPVFTENPRHYTITLNNANNGSAVKLEVAYGAMPEYTAKKDPDAQYTYTFTGWNTPFVAVTGTATYTAQWSTTVNRYDITWMNGDEELEVDENQAYGATTAYNGATPTKEMDDDYVYTFSKWKSSLNGNEYNNGSTPTVAGTTTYLAQYTTTCRYAITFNNYDGSQLARTIYTVGQTPSYDGLPTRPRDRDGYFRFDGWKNSDGTKYELGTTLPAVSKKETYTAQYVYVTDMFTITLNNVEDDVPTWSGKFGLGSTPFYNKNNDDVPVTPTKSGDINHEYTFSGWSPALQPVTANATYTAQFEEHIRKYAITWKNYDGTTIKTDQVEYGTTPSYTGSTPTKPQTAAQTFTFTGWSPTVTAVSGDAEYTAQFTPTTRQYNITWVDGNGATLKTDKVNYGATPVYSGATPTKSATAQYSYTFNNTWSPAIVAVNGDATYTAQFNSTVNTYTITWVDGNGATLKTEQVAYGSTPSYTGATPTKTATAQYTYTFNSNWTPTIVAVTGAATYTAQFNSTVNKYPITWVDGDGNTIKTDQVEYGTVPNYTGSAPTKTSTAQYEYTFTNWDVTPVAVTGAATYTAQFSSTTRTYTIRFANVDGNGAYEEVVVAYGGTPVCPVVPEKVNGAYEYEFLGWNTPIVAVTGPATYTATYSSTPTERKYTITWLNDDNSLIETTRVLWNVVPTHADPSKAATVQYTYTFAGWNPTPVAVTGPATYKATFNATVNQYEVSFNLQYHGLAILPQTKDYGAKIDQPANPSATGWTFGGWYKEAECTHAWNFASDEVHSTTVLYAKWTINTHNLTWNWDGGETSSTTHTTAGSVAYDTELVYPANNTMTKTGYTFAGWSSTPSRMPDADLTITAQWTPNTNTPYVVKHWQQNIANDEYTEVTGDQENKQGTTATTTAAVAKSYTGFTAQPISQQTIASNGSTVVNVYYNRIKYTITWANYNGSTIKTDEVKYGATPEYTGADPEKVIDNCKYDFLHWDNTPVPVTGNATYTAVFSENCTQNNFLVVFQNYDGTPLYAAEVKAGETPVYGGEEPTKAGYDFSGWSPTIGAISEHTVYTAQFAEPAFEAERIKGGVRVSTGTWATMLSEANQAANAGSTIKLHKNVTATVNTEIKQNMTIDLNGCTISCSTSNTGSNVHMLYINAAVTLTIEDMQGGGMISFTGTGTGSRRTKANYYAVEVYNTSATLVVNSGIIQANSTATSGGNYTSAAAVSLYNTNSTLNMNGGEVIASASAGKAYAINHDESTNYGYSNISGGKLKAKTAIFLNPSTGRDKLSGGYYSLDPGTKVTIATNHTKTTVGNTEPEKAEGYNYKVVVSTGQNCTVTWKQDDGTQINQTTVTSGGTPTHANPSKADGDLHRYEFAGWNPTLAAIQNDATYTATYHLYVQIGWNIDGNITYDWVKFRETPSHADPVKPADAQYTYTFAGWEPAITAATCPKTYTAQFNEELRSYTITFANLDGNNSQQEQYVFAYGATPVCPVTPLKEEGGKAYEFLGWSPEIATVTGDATYTATFSDTPSKTVYTITWKDDQGNTIETTKVAEDELPTHTAPEKANTAEYTYTFTGWTPAVVPATADATYQATFSSVKNKYTITFQDWDGTVLQSDMLDYGTPITAPTPSRPAYNFNGWSPAVATTVTGDATYTATYTFSGNVASVTNAAGTNTQYYTTWDAAFSAAQGSSGSTLRIYTDITLSSQQDVNTAMTLDLNGCKITCSTTSVGSLFYITSVAMTVVDSKGNGTIDYKVTGNTYAIIFDLYETGGAVVVNGGTFLCANTYNGRKSYLIYLNANGCTASINGGELKATASSSNAYVAHNNYGSVTVTGGKLYALGSTTNIFYSAANTSAISGGYYSVDPGNINLANGYTKEDVESTEPERAEGYVKKVIKSLCVVTWKNYDGTTLGTNNVNGGSVPVYTGATPTKPSTDQYEYAFAGWDPEVSAITDDIIYTAQFTETLRSYTITWKDGDGNTLATDEVEYGSIPSYTGLAIPTKAADAEYTYTYNYTWSPNIVAVTGDATYTAQFNNVKNKYDITWVDGDGNTLKTDKVEYGETPVYDGETPTKTEDANYKYTFNDTWSPAITSVTGDATYTAQFTPVSKEIGFYVDIVDVDNSAKTLKLNVSGTEWVTAGWPYEVNSAVYYRDQAKATAAGSDKYRATDRTLTIPYTGEPGENFTVTIRNASSTLVSKHTYIIPQEIKSATTLTTDQAAPIFVKGATLTIDADITATNIYVGYDAKLVINSGKTLTADTVFFRTTPESAAELIYDGTISGKVYYTRIIKSKSGYFQFGLPLSCLISAVRLSNNNTVGYKTGSGWILRYYGENLRATSGPGDNWVTLDGAASIAAGRGYEMYSGVDYYREFYFPVDLSQLTNTVHVDYTAGDQPTNNGWNVLVSPLTHTYTQTPQPEMNISWMQLDGSFLQEPLTTVAPAMTFAYQAAKEGSIVFDGSSVTVPTLAPRRRVAAVEEPQRIQWMHLDIKDANGLGDQTSIYSHPTRYDQTFQSGIDEEKQSLTASRALIYSSHAYGEMAFAGVSDELLEQGVALTVYSPKAQELTISMRENEWLNRMAFVWLIDQATGAQIDLLESDYSFNAEAGTTAGRFILMGAFFAPQITTDNGTVQSDDEDTKAKKFIYNDKMYIQINGVIYDATGKLVK